MDGRKVRLMLSLFSYVSSFALSISEFVMSLEIAKRIAQLIPYNSIDEIRRLMSPYTFEQRRFIMSTEVGGSSFLYDAILNGCPLIAIYFLDECGADPNSFGRKHYEKVTCLWKATYLDDKDMVEILLRRGADINGVSFGYRTAITTACFQKNVELARFFVENGANLSIQNIFGNDTLMSSLHQCELFQYLVENGANINLVDSKGYTILMHALKLRQKKIITFLLAKKDIDVRKQNEFGEDALNLAMRFSTGIIIQKIISIGQYTEKEIIRGWELESAFCYMYGTHYNSNASWRKVLRLRDLPRDTPIFNNILPNNESDNDISLFKENFRQPLLFLRSLCGPRHVFTLRATVIALSFVTVHHDFLEIYEIFSKILHSLNNNEFLQIDMENVFKKYICNFSHEVASLEKFFKMLTEYILLFRTKYQQPMTSLARSFYNSKFKDLVNSLIKLIPLLMKKYSFHTIHQKIENILQIDFKNVNYRSIAQICLKRRKMSLLKMFLLCGTNVNQTDDNDETVLHYLLDSNISREREFTELIIDAGFDFSRVTSTKYCLPCRMKKKRLFCYPEECNTLQCLAAKVICEKTVFWGTDIPPILRTIIQMHMNVP